MFLGRQLDTAQVVAELPLVVRARCRLLVGRGRCPPGVSDGSLLVVLLIAERARAGIGLGMNRETKL